MFQVFSQVGDTLPFVRAAQFFLSENTTTRYLAARITSFSESNSYTGGLVSTTFRPSVAEIVDKVTDLPILAQPPVYLLIVTSVLSPTRYSSQ